MAKPKRALPPKGASKKPQRSVGQKIGRFAFWSGVTLLILGALGLAAFAIILARTPIPDPNKDFQTNVTTVYYADGKTPIGTFAVHNRVSIPLSEMPQHAKDAIIAAENASFWTDPGISVSGLTRAVISAVRPGDTVGGSTITQQYVKVLYLSQDKTVTRKLKELVIALKVGKDVPKEQILEGYLNTVYFGRGAYGIQAAAKAYFAKDARDLDLAQSVALVSLVNAPNLLDPAKGEKQAADLLERYQYTLHEMVTNGFITEAEKAEIYSKLPKFPKIKKDSRMGGQKGFLLTMVREELTSKGFEEAQIDGGGFKIISTFEKAAQDGAVQAAQNSAKAAAAERGKDWKQLHPAIASVDTATGGVIALYGGRDFVDDTRNWATTARETGSTFKPWALVAALREGFGLDAQFDGSQFDDGAGRINNAGGRNYGSVSLIKATTSSINSAYVDIVRQIPDGPNQVIKAANDAGIPTAAGWDPTLRIALGNPMVSPLHAAAGYATLANGGVRNDPHVVKEMKDADGAIIYKATPEQTQSIEDWVAQDATYALTNVTTSGTGRAVSSLGHEVAGKTGTKYDSVHRRTVASWFVGYTKQVSTAVMFVAGDSGVENLDDFSSGFYGSNYPARTWLATMQVIMSGKEQLRFEGPSGHESTRKSTSSPKPTVVRSKEKDDDKDKDEERPEETQAPEPEETTYEPEPEKPPTERPTDEPTREPTSESTREPGGRPTGKSTS